MIKADHLEQIAKHGLSPFPVGQVTNPLLPLLGSSPVPRYTEVIANQPARLQATVIDLRHVARPIRPMVYISGAIAFAADVPTVARIQLVKGKNRIEIGSLTPKAPIVRHTAMLMQTALETHEGLRIDVEAHNIRHVGLGSSAAVQVAVGAAINYLYGNPIPPQELIRYLSQNYGEDMHGEDNYLVPVQSTGSGAACGLLGGGMVVITGEAALIKRIPVPESMSFVIGVPDFYQPRDSLEAFASETGVFDDMLAAHGKERALKMAYEVLHKLLPAMTNGDWITIGNVLWHLRLDHGSFDRLDKMTPGFKEFVLSLAELRESGLAPVLSPSSAGPGVFALSSYPVRTKAFFEHHGARTLVAPVNNCGLRFEAR